MFKEKARPDYYVDFTASSGWFKHTRSLSMLSIHLQLGSLELAGEPGPCPPIPAPACVPTHTHTLAHTNSTNSLLFPPFLLSSFPPSPFCLSLSLSHYFSKAYLSGNLKISAPPSSPLLFLLLSPSSFPALDGYSPFH